MNDQNQNTCLCHQNLTELPIHGLKIAVDTSALALCDCKDGGTAAGRHRVTEELHVYVSGNLTESGDGLTPETAVKSYEDAVDVLSLYDGCNKYIAHLHFADLAAGQKYLDVIVVSAHHTSFKYMHIHGQSHDTTVFSAIYATLNAYVVISNVKLDF